MGSSVVLKAKDFTNEPTRFGFNTLQITSANIVAQLALIQTLQDAVDGVALGVFSGKTVQALDVPTGVKAAVENAQRESKWRVVYTDDVTPLGNGSFEIGMPDLTLLVAGEGNMDVSAGAGLTLVNAIEAVVLSRQENAITVLKISHVGRNI